MADIELKCPECGSLNVISEYVPAKSRICAQCGHALSGDADKSSADSASPAHVLTLRRAEQGRKTTLQGNVLADRNDQDAVDIAAEGRQTRGAVKVKKSSRLLGLMVFLVLSGVLLGIQYLSQNNKDILHYYLQGRWAVILAGMLLIVYEASLDSQVKGVVCLLFPPYLIFYALSSVETYWRQSVFLAIVVMLGGELYFLQPQSVAHLVETHLDRFIIDVANQIDRAGEAPDKI